MRILGGAAICVVLWAGLARPGIPCEPCSNTLDLKSSLRKADLVVIGRRQDYKPEERAAWDKGSGPATVVVRVERTLKGKAGGDTITVKSWSGMCSYG